MLLIRTQIRAFTAVACIFMLSHLALAAPDTAGIRAEIVRIPVGTNIELRLKNQQKLRGVRGAVSDSGFSLVDSRSGERQIDFDDVASVKQVKANSHTGRNINILIGVGIGVGIVAIVIVTLAHKGGYL